MAQSRRAQVCECHAVHAGVDTWTQRWLAGTEDIAEASKGLVKFFDLTDPVFMGMYDWAISIEVAEHLPPFLEPAIW